MIGLLGRLIKDAAAIATAPVRTASACAAPTVRMVLPPAVTLESVGALAVELLGGKPSRRYWRGERRCWIEVRGLRGPHGGDVGDAVVRAVRAQSGVSAAQLNYPLSRVVVFIADPKITTQSLCDVVAAAEQRASDTTKSPESEDDFYPRDLPADGIALTAQVISAAVTGVGFCAALAGRLTLWPAMPSGLTAVVTALEYQPRLRAAVEQHLGAAAADSALALVAATVYTATQAPAALAVEFVRHVAQVGEAAAGARAWAQQEPVLARHADCRVTTPGVVRPRPVPPGPVERHVQRSARAQLLAPATVGVLTAKLDLAGVAAAVTAPKATRNARESFAATLARGLADQHGVLPLRPDALRLLDRVDAVVVDPRALVTEHLRVAGIRGIQDDDRAGVWQWAHDEVERGAMGPGWHRASHRNGSSGAEVFVRHAHHPLAAPVLGEVRRAGAEAVSVDTDELDDLRSSFDELREVNGSVDAALARTVTTLQSDGRTVAVLSVHAAEALSAADVAIGVLRPDAHPPWNAHLLVDDLAGAWRVLHALPAARKASERGVELATGGTILGALAMMPGVRSVGTGPVTAGAAAGLTTGFLLARGVLRDEAPAAARTYDWHAMSVEQVRRQLPPPQSGVASTRAKARAIAPTGAVRQLLGPPRRLIDEVAAALRIELSDPLTPVLAIGSAASALLGSPVDALLVGGVLTGNSMLAATQQVRAERLLRRLLAVQDPPGRRVLGDPDGTPDYETVSAAQLRAGDVIEVRPGEVVPADARLIRAVDVEADESSLTGESLPVPKGIEATPGAPLAERSCMLHATTTVLAGTAVAIVTAVGAQTQARRAAAVPSATGSPVGLQGQLRELTNRALPFGFAGGALVSGLGLLRRFNLHAAVSSGVAVAVAAVPEGMPLVATLAQQASARRLTKSGVLVRSPRSVEALGRVDVVCFDKTGTLSENRLRVAEVFATGGFSRDQVISLAGGATPPKNGKRHEHATDRAVAAAAAQIATARPNGEAAAYLPFRSGRPYSASIVGDRLQLKGAPEVVLAACADVEPSCRDAVQRMAEDGLRVIAVAHRDLTPQQSGAARDDGDNLCELCGHDLKLAGLLGLSDTPREESAAVLESLRERGIGVRLITGDHPVTATAIAAELGMPVTAEQVISGSEWEALPRRGQERAVRDRLVFARMTPEHKVQIVQTLERMGLICAMVGDGSNDAAAIRAATVGIGVAAAGSDPARIAANVMLLDGQIGSLLAALDEGRQLWLRVQAAVSVLLGGNAGEVAFAIVGTALTGRSPLNTRQLLVVNMMTDALPAAALAVSPANWPANGAGHGPNRAAIWRTVAIRGTTTAAAATAAWLMAGGGFAPRHASTVGLVALVSTQLGQTLIDSHSPLVVATAAGSLVSLGTLISVPGVSQLMGCTPLGPLGWSQALGTAAVATAAAAVAPRLLSLSIPTTPLSAGQGSRNGVRAARRD